MNDGVYGSDPAERREPRLEFRDGPSASSARPVALDGAWWPCSRDGAGELAALIGALDARQAQVGLLMLNPHGWRGHPSRIELMGRSVRIEWITMLDRSVVIGATARGDRIDLHLVMPAGGDDPGAVATVATAPAGTPPAALPEQAAIGAKLARLIRVLDALGTENPDAWVERVRLILAALRADLRRYDDFAQAPAGIYDRIIAKAPRLSNAIANVEREHLRIAASLDRLVQWAQGPHVATQRLLLRNEGLTLVRHLIRYQQHGADLLHQADEVDLGGQG